MQDILLEPYGGEVLHLGVGATTTLTALLGVGTLIAFAIAARELARGTDPYRLAGLGALVGVIAFATVIFAAPFASPLMFRIGATLIGFRRRSIRHRNADRRHGARGEWKQRPCARRMGRRAGLRHRARDGNRWRHPRCRLRLAARGALGPALTEPSVGYCAVYNIEILLLVVTLAAVGPLVRPASEVRMRPRSSFGLAEFPG